VRARLLCAPLLCTRLAALPYTRRLLQHNSKELVASAAFVSRTKASQTADAGP
jgi:hypothetical protein